MYSLALALSMVALEEAAASARDGVLANSPEPAPLDAGGRAAHAAAWRRWAAEGRDGLVAAPSANRGGSSRQPGPLGWVQLLLSGRTPAPR